MFNTAKLRSSLGPLLPCLLKMSSAAVWPAIQAQIKRTPSVAVQVHSKCQSGHACHLAISRVGKQLTQADELLQRLLEGLLALLTCACSGSG